LNVEKRSRLWEMGTEEEEVNQKALVSRLKKRTRREEASFRYRAE
jgi:hypothetical protein